MVERVGMCEDCSTSFPASGSRGRVPKRCTGCALRRKVAANLARYRKNPPKRQPRVAREPRFRPICCVECGLDFQVQVKPGGLPKSCDQCKHDRRLRLAREVVRPPEVRLAQRLRRYGLTPAEWQEMVAQQNGCCAICDRPPAGTEGRSAMLEIDHCHATGEVRALLCQSCNNSLGKFQDSPELLRRAADYIEFHRDRVSQEV